MLIATPKAVSLKKFDEPPIVDIFFFGPPLGKFWVWVILTTRLSLS